MFQWQLNSKATVNICFFEIRRTKYESNRLTPTLHIKLVNQLFYTMIVIVRSLRRSQTNILYLGESTLDVDEQTVGEMTIIRSNYTAFSSQREKKSQLP